MALLITVDLFLQILGGKVEAMVKWTYKQLPEPATVVMTNLSVGECTGINEYSVHAELRDPGWDFGHKLCLKEDD